MKNPLYEFRGWDDIVKIERIPNNEFISKEEFERATQAMVDHARGVRDQLLFDIFCPPKPASESVIEGQFVDKPETRPDRLLNSGDGESC